MDAADQPTKPRRLVGLSEVGRMANTSRQGAWNLMDQRTHPDAPDPDPEVAGRRMWDETDIIAYFVRLGRPKTWED